MILPWWAVRATDAAFFLGKVPLNLLISTGCDTKFFGGLKLRIARILLNVASACERRSTFGFQKRPPLGGPGCRSGERAEAHFAYRSYVEALRSWLWRRP